EPGSLDPQPAFVWRGRIRPREHMQSATKPSGRRAGFARARVLAGAISLALAMLTTGNLSLFPPRLKTSELQVAAATTHVMIDTGGLSAVHRIEDRVPGLTKRAELFG